MAGSNRRGHIVAAPPFAPHVAGFSPARIVPSQTLGRLAALKSTIRRGAYKKGGSATRTPDSNRSPFGSAKAAPLLREVLLFFRRPLCKTLPPVFPLPPGLGSPLCRYFSRSRGGWGCGISLYPTAERTPCFSATPSIGTQNATAASEQPPRPRSAALLSPYARPAQRIKPLQPPSAVHARRNPPFCKQSCTTFVQRNKNIILCRSSAKNRCRAPINAAELPHLCKSSCNLQLCPRPAHIARFNERARAREPNQPNGFSTPPKSPTSFTDISPEEACSTLSTSAQPSKFCFWLNSALPEQLPLQPGAVLYWPRI